MGKAKWWVCDSCKSLNDLPANKCYKCRTAQPKDPTLIDDQYSKVGGGERRVGITVDLSQVGELTRPDPVETAQGGGVMEAFEKVDDPYADLDRMPHAGRQPPATPPPGAPRYDPYAGGYETEVEQPGPKPLREPVRRGIDALGGLQWAFDDDPPATAEAAAAPAPSAPPLTPEPQSAPPPGPPPEQQSAPPPTSSDPAPPSGSTPVPAGAVPPPGPIPPQHRVPPPPPGAVPHPPSAALRPPAPPPVPPPGVPRPPGVPPPPPPPGIQGRPPGAPPPPPGGPPPPPGGPLPPGPPPQRPKGE